MRRLAFTPRWIAGLAVCVAAAVVCALLGRWQWDVAQAHGGTLQNSAYAFNWWLFSVLFVGFWFKALHDTVVRDAAADPARAGRRPVPPVSAKVRMPAPQPAVVLPTAEDDPEVAEWNDWLREMNAGGRA